MSLSEALTVRLAMTDTFRLQGYFTATDFIHKIYSTILQQQTRLAKTGVANLFVMEGHLIFVKHGAGCTVVFIKHGVGCTSESQPKFQNYFWHIYTSNNVILYPEYLLAIHSLQALLQRDKDLHRDEIPFH